jgi:serine/threonine protein kinase/actin-like ATPase involved in cell morphogenesis
MFTLGNQSTVTPAVVYLREDGTLIAGEAANHRAASSPERAVREFKRRLGDPLPILMGGAQQSAVELMAVLLREVLRHVSQVTGSAPEQVVLTHPANWGPFRCGLFEEVPRLAGLPHAATITEPEAAGVNYAATHRLQDGELLAVYDLGGGTFDVTILRKESGRIEILGAPEGIDRLGGIDFDDAILNHVNRSLDWALNDLDPREPAALMALTRLRRNCVLAKEVLSKDSETVVPVYLPDRQFTVPITRTEFEELVRPQIESTMDSLIGTLRSARVSANELSAVILTGGSSRIPLVAQMLSENVGRPIVVDSHPKHAVALGAAIFAATLTEPPPVHQRVRDVAAEGVRRSPSAAEPSAISPPAPRVTKQPVGNKLPDSAEMGKRPEPVNLSAGITLGQMFGPYRIDQLLGGGGASEVFKAYHVEQDRVVALKLIAAHGTDGEFRTRFLRDSQVTARLTDPHIIPIHNWGEINGRLYLDMRFVEGVDLRSRLDVGGPLPPTQAVTVISQIARALDAAHRSGLVHRDVKPSNVLLSKVGEDEDVFAYLMDFGAARALSSEPSTALPTAVRTGPGLGSLDYTPPERFLGQPIDGRADVYALGCVLFECLTGERPFPVVGMGPCMNAHLATPPPRPSTHHAAVPVAMDEVVATAMSKNAGDRFPTAGALASAARRALMNSRFPPDRPAAARSGPRPAPAGDATRISAPNRPDQRTTPANVAPMDRRIMPTVMRPPARAGSGTAPPSSTNRPSADELRTVRAPRPSVDQLGQSAGPLRPPPTVGAPRERSRRQWLVLFIVGIVITMLLLAGYLTHLF